MDDFISKLSVELQRSLPGFATQLLMAPPSRNGLDAIPEDHKVSSVAVLLLKKEKQWQIVLIRRTDYGGTHSGQISFPGGRVEESDCSLLFTASREMFEEIGISWSNSSYLGCLTPLYIPPSNFMVYPFVFVADDVAEFVLSVDEVKEVLYFPIANLCNPAFKGEQIVGSSGNVSLQMNVPTYELNETNFIWGATAMILRELEVVVSRETICKN